MSFAIEIIIMGHNDPPGRDRVLSYLRALFYQSLLPKVCKPPKSLKVNIVEKNN